MTGKYKWLRSYLQSRVLVGEVVGHVGQSHAITEMVEGHLSSHFSPIENQKLTLFGTWMSDNPKKISRCAADLARKHRLLDWMDPTFLKKYKKAPVYNRITLDKNTGGSFYPVKRKTRFKSRQMNRTLWSRKIRWLRKISFVILYSMHQNIIRPLQRIIVQVKNNKYRSFIPIFKLNSLCSDKSFKRLLRLIL